MTSYINRRSFLSGATTIAATGAALSRAAPASAQNRAFGDVVESQSFARLEKIGERTWAVVSTPFNDDGSFNAETVCNGGLILGDDRLVAIDGFLQPAGGAWLSAKALEVTGRPITDVIVTHFHADHSGGLAGFQNGAEGPDIIATETTRQLIYERYSGPSQPVEDTPFSAPTIRPVLPNRILTEETKISDYDIGGAKLFLDPLKGHTPSDLAVIVGHDPVVFAGDIIWAGIFHNYVDAIPSHLTVSAKKLLADPQRIIVTGHGYIARASELTDYIDLLDLVEEKARASHAAGYAPEDGAADFAVPESLGEWALFNPRAYSVAFEAWRRELDGETE